MASRSELEEPSRSVVGSVALVLVFSASAAVWVGGPRQLVTTALAMGCISLVWAAWTGPMRRLDGGWRVALLGLLSTAFIALYPSIDLDLSLPRLCGIVIGIGTLAMLLRFLAAESRLRAVAWSLSLVAPLVIVAGVLLTDWPRGPGKGFAFESVYDWLPQWPEALLDAPSQGLNPNKLGAPLAMLLPLVAGVGWFAPKWPQRWLALCMAALLGLVLLLTQSRSAYLAGAGGVLVLLVLRWRWFAVLVVPYVGFLGWVALYGFGPQALVADWPVPPMTPGIGLQFDERRLVWDIALSMVEDFPLTGIGLGTFPDVANLLYGQALLIGPDTDTPHAHNLFLQVAVDLGLPGLGFFALLSACLLRAARRAVQRAPSPTIRGLAAGSGCGLLAYYLFGLTDAIGLGEKPGLLFWTLAGILVACARVVECEQAGARIHDTRELRSEGVSTTPVSLAEGGQVGAQARITGVRE